MNEQQLPVCPKCGKPAAAIDAPFCAYCGAAINQSAAPATPDGAKAALQKADAENDPVKKHAILAQAEKDYPDCLEVAEALLMLGRLHERNPKKPDFSVIKCHLLHMYLTPEDFPPAKRDEMRRELFEHPQLLRCQELSGNAQAFTSSYLQKLSVEFVRLFLEGSNLYMHSIFGFSMGRRAAKQLAAPVASMMKRILADDELTSEQQQMLYAALYRGFLTQVSGESTYIDEALKAQGDPIPTRA